VNICRWSSFLVDEKATIWLCIYIKRFKEECSEPKIRNLQYFFRKHCFFLTHKEKKGERGEVM
jgi:hypothetical protein